MIIDYAWEKPSVDSLVSAGVTGVIRYLSTDPAKNLSHDELDALTTHGIPVALVWETTADRALDGYSAGVEDATQALNQKRSLGLPDTTPIYFAVDTDVTEDQASGICSGYLAGCSAALGNGWFNLLGVYGGYTMINAAAVNGIRYLWQTSAWSGGQWHPSTTLRQTGQTVIGTVDVDVNTSQRDDWGQYPQAVNEPTWPGRYLHIAQPLMTGDDIRDWQQRMRDRGWLDSTGAPLVADGVYGVQSATVCRKFQTEKSLTVDGIVGPATWDAAWTAPVT